LYNSVGGKNMQMNNFPRTINNNIVINIVAGSAPTPAAKPAGFRPVRFNPGSGDVGGLSSLQAAPAAVDVGFCDL
jgi:hypothetical protein